MGSQDTAKSAGAASGQGQGGKSYEPGDAKYRKCANQATSPGVEHLSSGGTLANSDRANNNQADKDPGGDLKGA